MSRRHLWSRALRYSVRTRPTTFWAVTLTLATAVALVTGTAVQRSQRSAAACTDASHDSGSSSGATADDPPAGTLGPDERAVSVDTPRGLEIAVGDSLELVPLGDAIADPAPLDGVADGRAASSDERTTVVVLERADAVRLAPALARREVLVLRSG